MKSLKKKLESSFSDIKINITDDSRITVNIKKDAVVSILNFLKNLGYEHLALISCIDWIEENEFELVYILSAYMGKDQEYNEKEKKTILVKTRISREESEFITVINIFENAEPYERELHELFGINFEGHPRLTPLFLERDYEIPPFRKDFDTRKYVKDVFDKIPSIEERKK
ncbi:NADH-quinone oxidoreductase subunit C [candidate division TA06 bacterium]|uniref:NADH-quinone oxidoreductase subunit C n=1 Tax=candidate division TA06 bacterium TaxID=2250710 RepID=A0A660SAP8_UNCT6|nr:MAG: NADH-quinone oxidoreductase subunit C [candidate division TA06 bacterium]